MYGYGLTISDSMFLRVARIVAGLTVTVVRSARASSLVDRIAEGRAVANAAKPRIAKTRKKYIVNKLKSEKS